MDKKVCYMDFISYAVEFINEYGIDITYDEVIKRYSESHRHFHTVEHLNDVLKQILKQRNQFQTSDLVSLIIAAVFHDIVYDPQRRDNEEKSVEVLKSYERFPISDFRLENAKKIILATKTHDKIHELIYNFNKIDCSILDRSYDDLLVWEEQISKEYEFAGWKEYKERRIKFLELSIPEHMNNEDNLKRLIDYVKNNYLS